MRVNIKLCVMSLLVALLMTGCVLSRMIVPDVDTRMSQGELDHLKDVNGDFNTTLLSLAETPGLDRKGKLYMAKVLLKGNKEVTGIKPSAAENMVQQYARMVGREGVDDTLNAGVEWSKGLIAQVAGGGVAGSGLIATIVGLMRSRNRKTKALGVVSSELDEEAKAKVKKALEHTGMEKEVV